MAQKLQSFVNFLNNFVHMVIPFTIARQGYAENFCFFTHLMFLILTFIGSKSLLERGNVILIFIELEPVSRHFFGQIVNILLDLAIVVLKYRLRDSNIV